MLPLEVFSSRAFSAAALVGLLMNLGFYGELFVMTLFLQQVRGFSPLAAGLALLPEAAMATIGSIISGRLMARSGPRLPMLGGLSLGALGLFSLTAVGAHSSYLLLVPPFVAIGLGMSATMPAATAAIMEQAPPDRAGLASGTLNAARQIGGLIGVALLGSLVAPPASFIPGLRIGLAIAGVTFVLAALVTAVAIGRVTSGSRRTSGRRCPNVPTNTARDVSSRAPEGRRSTVRGRPGGRF